MERRAAENHRLQPINGEVIYDARAGSWEPHPFSAVHFSLWVVVPHICDLDPVVGSHSFSRRQSRTHPKKLGSVSCVVYLGNGCFCLYKCKVTN